MKRGSQDEVDPLLTPSHGPDLSNHSLAAETSYVRTLVPQLNPATRDDMQRRQFLSVLTGASVGLPLTASNQRQSPVRMPSEVENMARQLAEAQQEKTKLLSALHEMRAPLNIILGYAELILDDAYGETSNEMRVALDKVKQGGYQVAELINAGFELELSKQRRRGVAG